jgi:HAD superfamily hydrolase (TIGR01509 family)
MNKIPHVHGSTIIKAVIFDMDGVLTDSMQYHIASWKYAFRKFHIFPTEEDIRLLEGMSYSETINFLSEKYDVKLKKAQKEEIYRIKKEKLSEIFTYKVYPQIPKLLGILKNKHVRLALASGAHKELVENIVNKFFKGFFEAVISGDDVKNGKPHPEPYLKAAKKLGCDFKSIRVIENAPLGIESAKKAHLTTFAIQTTLDKKYLQEADEIFRSHGELTTYMKKLIGQKKMYVRK